MNEKIKNFFACVGGIFSAVLAVLAGIFIGKRSRGNNVDNGRVSILEEQRGEFANNRRTERQIYSDLGELFATIEQRNAEKNDSDRNN